jgi:2,4-dienoyl-CoA reductase-like NADH-dependent reductase (Old Yellow Enzyme family)
MKLFEPYSFAGLELKNRLVRSATYEKRADVDGFVTDALIDFYRELTAGGVGLIITGNALVHPSGRSVPQAICIHNDHYIDGLKKLVDEVHRLDGTIIMQISHGGRQCFPALLGGAQPIAPSAVYDPSTKITPRAMDDSEIWELIDAFADAARRAMYAGFDGVQIHAAHGYLVNEFLSPHTNRRDDYWGGDEERRFHFIEEMFEAMKKEIVSTFPIMVKMNAEDFIEGGLTVTESLRIAKRLESIGLSAVEVSGGMFEAGKMTVRPNIEKEEQEAYFGEASGMFARELFIPVMTVGGIRSRSVAEDILQKEDAELVSLSRPLIREPDLPLKFMQGKERADCISCNNCMRFQKLDMIRCTQVRSGQTIR